MKATTVERYKKWCETAKATDTFFCEGNRYTKAEFDALHFGGKAQKPVKTINIDIEEELHEDLERPFDSGDTVID